MAVWYCSCVELVFLLTLTDLMQGYTPSEAFASLPRSLRGAHEGSLMAASAMPQDTDEEDLAWSLDREQVRSMQGWRMSEVTQVQLHVADMQYVWAFHPHFLSLNKLIQLWYEWRPRFSSAFDLLTFLGSLTSTCIVGKPGHVQVWHHY